MGDRAIIVLRDKDNHSPIIYCHWGGCHVNEYLDELDVMMRDRPGDLLYSAARLVGIIHNHLEPPYSLGMRNSKLPHPSKCTYKTYADLSNGDAGTILYDVNTKQRHYFRGYLEEQQRIEAFKKGQSA